LLATHRHFRMHEELGTGPGFHYLYAPADGAADDDSGPRLVADSIGQAAVAPRQQHNWDGRAAANFIAGGAGGGLAMALAGQALPGWLGLVAMALVGAGLFSVWAEIGRPWRFLNVFLNPQTSWMTREAMAAIAFFVAGLAGLVFAMPGQTVLSGVLAGGFVYSQARIIRAATGIPAWREPAVVPLIAVTGLAEGAGLVLIAGLLPAGVMAIAWLVAVALIVLVALRLVCWRTYRARLGASGAPTGTLDTLARFSRPFEIAGHVAPIALLGYGLLVPAVADIAYATAGALVLAAGGVFKFVLVCRAGFNQGYAVARLPARGAGTSARGIKPGWKTVPK
jgi:phenylacetyl-CoA:acceptor oxidoreductase subunit 2